MRISVAIETYDMDKAKELRWDGGRGRSIYFDLGHIIKLTVMPIYGIILQKVSSLNSQGQ